jgi:hypothetical protein
MQKVFLCRNVRGEERGESGLVGAGRSGRERRALRGWMRRFSQKYDEIAVAFE